MGWVCGVLALDGGCIYGDSWKGNMRNEGLLRLRALA
jgi:hypothetical protein